MSLTKNISIYKRLMRLVPEFWLLNYEEALTSCAVGYMDLSLNVLSRETDKMVISLSHYYKHPSGDMIPDPDMTIRVIRVSNPEYSVPGVAEALTYQDMYRYDSVYEEKEGKKYVYPKMRRSLNTFLNQWLLNCLHQEHKLQRAD